MARPDNPMRPARANRPAVGPSAYRRPAAPPPTLPGLEREIPPDVAHYRRLLERIERELARHRTERSRP